MLDVLRYSHTARSLNAIAMAEIRFDDVHSILSKFSELPDPRCDVNRKHLLGDFLVICIMSVIAGCDGPQAMGLADAGVN